MNHTDEQTKIVDILFTALSGVTYTRADMLRRIRILRQYFEFRYFLGHTDSDFASFAQSASLGEYDTQALVSLGEEFYASFTRENAYMLLDTLLERAKTAAGIHLYLPFVPDDRELLRLGEWMRKNAGVTAMLDLRCDGSLVGGFAMVRGDRYLDFTVRYFLDKQRASITSILDRYADA